MSMGNTKPSYQTTNNSNFTQKDVAESFKDKLLMKQRGEKLKKANFSFGHFNNRNGLSSQPNDISGHANKFHSDMIKQNQEAKQRGIELKKSNFELSKAAKNAEKGSTFQSMAQFQFSEDKITGDNMAQMYKKNSEVSKDLQTNLRSSHFEFGNTKGNQGSASHNAHQKFAIDQNNLDNSNKQVKKKMQSSNFKIGNSNHNTPAYQSTYKDSVNTNYDYSGHSSSSNNIDSKKTTIDIGKGKCYDYTSEQKSKFILPQGGRTIEHGGNHLGYLKANHFQLGNDKNDFSTVSKTDFGSKPNPGFKKHHGNVQKTSFQMGFQNNQFGSNASQGYTDRAKQVPYQRVVGDSLKGSNSSKHATSMQKENFSLGKSEGEFRTMNQAYYKWIQPKGDIQN